MFLIAITNSEIANKLESFNVEEFKINSSIVTIVTDNFLSTAIPEPNGFSIIESPFLAQHNLRDLILSQVTYKKERDILEIFKPTTSGRPIYYYINIKGNLFCSTHISMLRKAGVPIEENTNVLPEFFIYRCIMPPQTLYKNIKQLIIGSRLFIKFSNGKCIIKSINRYNPTKQDKSLKSVEKISKQTSNLLSESIKMLAPSKNRLAVLLSGGLDSSILTKICQNNYNINTTYSTGYPFEDPKKNTEKEYALSAAEAFQLQHNYYETTNEEYLRGFIEGISAAEEPLHHLQSVLFYLQNKGGFPKNKDIIINGLGADGVFGIGLHNTLYFGNKMFFRIFKYNPMIKLLRIASRVSGKGGEFVNHWLPKIRESQNSSLNDPNNIIWSLQKYGSENWVCNYFKVTRNDIIKNRYDTIKPFEDRSIYSIISILMLLEVVAITQSIWAKLGESQRKIIYYPYSQYDLLNYTYSIPWNMKLKKPKNILREVARQYNIPEFIINRRKSGMAIHYKYWAERGKIFESLVPLASKVFDITQIRNMQSPKPKKAMTYWNMLNYSIWKRLCINNEPLEILLEELNETI